MGKMIIVKVLGGLGNQMFQYASARSLAVSQNADLKMDISGFEKYQLRKYTLDQFHIAGHFAQPGNLHRIEQLRNKISNKILLKLLHSFKDNNVTYVKEKRLFAYDSRIKRLNNSIVYLYGYWQHPNYFNQHKDKLLKEFTLKKKPDEKNKKILDNIQSDNSVAIHVRRGDYLSNPKANKFHGLCRLDYYDTAVAYMKKKINKPVFYIFSDDPAWVKKNITIGENVYVCDINPPSKGIEDFRLMRNCRHFILANSSFSWWAAWLSEHHKKIVIAPKKWLNNQDSATNSFIPDNWITI